MKRAFALLLCLLTALPIFAGCAGGNKEEDDGAIIASYIASELYDYDPSYGFVDDAQMKMLGLIFEGLTRINAKGKMEKAIAKSWKYFKDPLKDEYKLQITLKDTKWNDGRAVTAEDFVFAWKRILSSDFASSASALLFDIKNARAAKQGEASIDDVGLYAEDIRLLEITFETDIDYEDFLMKCASPALVPLREDIVSRNTDYWSKKYTSLVSNGPFSIKGLDYDEGKLNVERNPYYFRDTEKDSLKKTVNPFRFKVEFKRDPEQAVSGVTMSPSDLNTLLDDFLNGKLFYLGDLPLDKRAEYEKKAVVTDIASAHTYFFNLDNPLFEDARVRKALSLALDREEIARILTFAEPATGVITPKVFEGKSRKDFRDAGGKLIETTANMQEAQKLLNEAGVKSGSFTITYKLNEADKAVAEYVKGVWESLGFTVTLRPLLSELITVIDRITKEPDPYYLDSFMIAFRSRDFDVIAIDHNMLSTDAFAVLASFSKEFSGMGIDMESGEYELIPHITGFDNDEYTAIIEEAFAEKDINKRAEILHRAEEFLVDEMPIIPLVFNKDFYLISKELKNVKSAWFGYRQLEKAKLKDYEKYIETDAPVE
ncbi:MAG: peptide ABC transporter substrate-binding protein [Clostridiales bacterium]|nr:peptide ABC transporter substrate-binding protein [Clostridiales bacterium]